MGDRPLFMNPDHPDRAARAADPDRRAPDVAASGLAGLGPTWRLYAEYWRTVRRHVPKRRERLRCYACLIGSLAVNRNAVRLLHEPACGLGLRLGALASEVGQRVLVAARGVRWAELRLRQR
jgi:hypothetical protein